MYTVNHEKGKVHSEHLYLDNSLQQIIGIVLWICRSHNQIWKMGKNSKKKKKIRSNDFRRAIENKGEEF